MVFLEDLTSFGASLDLHHFLSKVWGHMSHHMSHVTGFALPRSSVRPGSMIDAGNSATYGAISAAPTVSTLTLLSGRHPSLSGKLMHFETSQSGTQLGLDLKMLGILWYIPNDS